MRMLFYTLAVVVASLTGYNLSQDNYWLSALGTAVALYWFYLGYTNGKV